MATIQIFCKTCRFHLYTYSKRGKGQLVKCFVHKIREDNVAAAAEARGGDAAAAVCTCPQCSSVFCRPAVIKHKPAHKIIGGKVFWK